MQIRMQKPNKKYWFCFDDICVTKLSFVRTQKLIMEPSIHSMCQFVQKSITHSPIFATRLTWFCRGMLACNVYVYVWKVVSLVLFFIVVSPSVSFLHLFFIAVIFASVCLKSFFLSSFFVTKTLIVSYWFLLFAYCNNWRGHIHYYF